MSNESIGLKADKKLTFIISSLSAAGAAVFLSLPVIIGSVVDELGFTLQQAGTLGSSYFAGFLLTSLFIAPLFSRYSWRKIGIVGSLLLGVSFLLVTINNNYYWLLVTFLCSGVGAGTVFSLSIQIIGQIENPDSTFGWKLVAEQAYGALLLLLLPVIVATEFGFSAMMVFISIALLICSSPILLLKEVKRKHLTNISQSTTIRQMVSRYIPIWILLLGLFIAFAALSGVWAFVERLAVEQNISPEQIGRALSFSLLGGVIGALITVFQKDRLGRIYPIIFSGVGLLLVIFAYSLEFDLLGFALISLFLSLLWNYSLVYQMSQVVANDLDGKLSVFIAPSLALGGILGPALAGFLISNSFVYMLYGSAAIFTVGILIIVLQSKFQDAASSME